MHVITEEKQLAPRQAMASLRRDLAKDAVEPGGSKGKKGILGEPRPVPAGKERSGRSWGTSDHRVLHPVGLVVLGRGLGWGQWGHIGAHIPQPLFWIDPTHLLVLNTRQLWLRWK